MMNSCIKSGQSNATMKIIIKSLSNIQHALEEQGWEKPMLIETFEPERTTLKLKIETTLQLVVNCKTFIFCLLTNIFTFKNQHRFVIPYLFNNKHNSSLLAVLKYL